MADVAGIVLGVASLGLDVSTRLSSYVNAVNGRDEELESAQRKIQNFQESVSAIQSSQARLRNLSTIASVEVTTCLTACTEELKRLQALVVKLSAAPTPPTDLKGKFKEGTKKVTYPFHRPNVSSLEKALDQTNGILGSLLQALQINAISHVIEEIATLKVTTDRTATQISGIETNLGGLSTHTQSQAISTEVASTKQGVSSIQNATSDISTQLSTLHLGASGLSTQAQAISTQAGEIRQDINTVQNATTQLSSQLTGVRDEFAGTSTAISDKVDVLYTTIQSCFSTLHSSASQQQLASTQVSDKVELIKMMLFKISADQGKLLEHHRQPHRIESTELCSSQSSIDTSQPSQRNHYLDQVHTSFERTCDCFPQRARISYQQRLFRTLEIYTQTKETGRHHPSCIYAKSDKPTTTRVVRGEILAFRRLISSAISLTVSMTTGGGCFGISPMLRCVNVVDASKHPAFQLAEVLFKASVFHKNNILFPRRVFPKLERLLMAGRITFDDMNEYGESWVSTFLKYMGCHDTPGSIEFLHFLRRCAEHNFKSYVTSSDDIICIQKLCLAVGRLFRRSSFYHGNITAFDLAAFSEFGDIHTLTHKLYPMMTYYTTNRTILGFHILSISSPKTIHPHFECSISRAIVTRDESMLRKAITENPSGVNQPISPFGIGALAMSVSWPLGMNIILNCFANLSEPNIPLLAETYKYLEDCLQNSTSIISFQRYTLDDNSMNDSDATSQQCRHPECIQILKPLLAVGLPLCVSQIDFSNILSWPCSWGRGLIFQAIKKQMNQLKALALEHVPCNIAQSLGLTGPDALLDWSASDCCLYLNKHDIRIPMMLRVPRNPVLIYEYCYFAQKKLDGLLYPNFVNIANQAWDSGFRDIYGLGYCLFKFQLDLTALVWLLSHGLDLENSHSSIPIRFIFANRLACCQTFDVPFGVHNKTFHSLVTTVISWRQKDRCSCWCCPDGCTPFACFIQHCLTHNSIHIYSMTMSAEYLRSMRIIMATFEPHVARDPSLFDIFIRLFTFHPFSLRHTCCLDHRTCGSLYLGEPGSLSRRTIEPEEIEQIQEEDRDVYESLESLVLRFKTEYWSSEVGFVEFMTGYVLPRLQKEVERLDGANLTTEEFEAAEGVGVVWGPQKDTSTKPELDVVGVESWDLEIDPPIEYWLRKIDEL